jgi:hypothetical protein
MSARMIGEEPALIIGGTLQYIYCLVNEKKEIVEGKKNDIRSESHIWIFQMDSTQETNDWEIKELSFGGAMRVV